MCQPKGPDDPGERRRQADEKIRQMKAEAQKRDPYRLIASRLRPARPVPAR